MQSSPSQTRVFLSLFGQVAGMFIAQSAIEFVAFCLPRFTLPFVRWHDGPDLTGRLAPRADAFVAR